MNIKDVILGIAIIILTIFVSVYGISTLFPNPDYEVYCPADKVNVYIDNAADCTTADGRWNPMIGPKAVNEPSGYCDLYLKCSQEFDDANRERSKKVFLIALPLGIIIVALGAFFFGLEAVGAGIMGGGVGTLIYGSGAYWPYTQNWLRFLLSLVGLALLIWFAYFWNKKIQKKNKKR